MKDTVSTTRLWSEVILAAVIGSGELILMELFDAHPNVGVYEFIYPLAAGLLVGVFCRGPVWLIGPATMLCLPVGTIISAVRGSDGFNLWPIALMFFAALACIGLIGAAVGRRAQRFWIKNVIKQDV